MTDSTPSLPADGMLACEIKPRPLDYPLSDYHRAMSEGPLHYTWEDKPHRLVYDLIAAVRHYAALSSASPAVPAGYALVPVDVLERCIKGIDHLSEIARQWEPDYSSGADRRGWVIAKDAADDARAALAAAAVVAPADASLGAPPAGSGSALQPSASAAIPSAVSMVVCEVSSRFGVVRARDDMGRWFSLNEGSVGGDMSHFEVGQVILAHVNERNHVVRAWPDARAIDAARLAVQPSTQTPES